MVNPCLICDRISQIKNQQNPFFVIELKASYVVLGDSQFYKGYTLILSKTHTPELHLLPRKDRENFLKEMALVGEAVYNTFQPKKLNYEILGNEDPHVHCHIFPRYEDDPNPTKPIWVVDQAVRNSPQSKLNASELSEQIENLKENIQKLLDSEH